MRLKPTYTLPPPPPVPERFNCTACGREVLTGGGMTVLWGDRGWCVESEHQPTTAHRLERNAMRRLQIEEFGTEVQGIRLKGNPSQPEPESVRIRFPGGEVDVTRATDGADCDYWVHVHVHDNQDLVTERAESKGRLVDARLDFRGRSTSEVDCGDFSDPNLYHLAVRISRLNTEKDSR